MSSNQQLGNDVTYYLLFTNIHYCVNYGSVIITTIVKIISPLVLCSVLELKPLHSTCGPSNDGICGFYEG